MKRVYVADIKPDDQVEDVFRVVEARLAPYRDQSKGHYLHLLLADCSGQVEARLWENPADVAQWLAPGELVRIKARATLYQDRIRLRLAAVEPAELDGIDASELLPAPAADVSEALAVIHAAIDRMVSQPFKSLLGSFFGDGDFVTAFSLAPPERPGALVAQTVQLVELAAPLRSLAVDLDWDLLLAAILLHDAGATLAVAGGTGSRAVAWLGVAALSDQLVAERLAQRRDFPAGLVVSLRHAILSAGDPAAARSKEAAVLSRLKELQDALAKQSSTRD